MASSTGRAWKSKEDYRKEKELEEARKAGTVAPELDEDGKEINPHIPQYISQAPWYLNNTKPSLKHQRSYAEKVDFLRAGEWMHKGIKGPAAEKFRKGSCTNCGAMTHQSKFCVERPRKVGAKFTNDDIKPDEIIQEVLLDYDGKRDHWNGYDARLHKQVVEEFEAVDHKRREQKARQLENAFMTEPDPSHQRYPHSKEEKKKGKEKKLVDGEKEESGESDSEDEGGKGENEDVMEHDDVAPIQKIDPRTRTTIRNLRIREDTAKYLRNLDLNSAYYDPKTRSMRENPNPSQDPNETVFKGDNFVRHSGDFQRFASLQSYMFEAYEKGQDVHLLGAPSQAELLHRQFKVKKETLKSKLQESVLSKYGGEEHLDCPPKELLIAQTEKYVEYSRDGQIVKGGEKAIPKSKYEEEVFINNHSAVWGSWWVKGQWGYACCHQLVKNSYCTGEQGKQAVEAANNLMINNMKEWQERQAQKAKELEEAKNKTDEEKKADAAAKAAEEAKFNDLDDRKRPYNSHRNIEVTEEEMEEFRAKRIRFDDPMRAYFEEKAKT